MRESRASRGPAAGAARPFRLRSAGRPRKGRGVKVISVSVERTLLARSDAVARRMGVTRAGLIERGLKAILAAQGE